MSYFTEGPNAPKHLEQKLGGVGDPAGDATTAVVLIGGGLVAWWLFLRKDKEGWTRRERKANARARAREAL